MPADPLGTPTQELRLLLSERETAHALNVCPRTVWALERDGRLKCVRIGRRKLFALDDVRAFIASAKGGGDEQQ